MAPPINYLYLCATLCLFFFLFAVVPISLEASKTSEAHLICSNQRVRLTRVSQLEQLQKSIEEDKSLACSENTREALKSLISLVKNESNKYLCSQEKADEILAFYREIDLEHLHKDLRKIYLAYGLQVSDVCRKSMVDQLTKVVQSKEVLSEQDFNEINLWTDEKGPFAKLLSEPSDYEDLVIPKHMVKLMKAKDKLAGPDESVDKIKMFMQTSTNGTIGSIKSTCRRKFKPVYDQLIAPLVTLSSVGFNYKGEIVAREKDTNRQVFQWYRIVFMCETLSGVEVLEDPVDQDHAKVRVFTTDEARTVFGSEAVDNEGVESDEVQEGTKPLDLHASLAEPVKPLDDLLLDTKDKHLLKAIKKHKEPSDRLNSRLNLKLVKFVLSTLKNKLVKVAGRLVIPFRRKKPDKVKEKLTKETYTSEEVLKFFEELKTQIEKKNEIVHTKTKKDRFIWKPIRLIINFTLISVFFLGVFAIIFTIVSFFGHLMGLVAAPLALAHAAFAKMAAIPHALAHMGAAAKGLVPHIAAPHIPPVHMPPVHMPHIPPVHIPPVHVPPVHIPPVHVPPVHIPPVHVPPVHVPPVHIPPVHLPPVHLPTVPHIPPVHITPPHIPGIGS